MKKVILSAAIMAITGFTAVNAKSIENTTIPVYAVVQDSTQSKEVKLEELPAPVKATLGADAYKDWTPASATWVKTKDGEHFAIVVTKGQEKAVLKIDPAGKVIQ
ncbi:MAG: hypothetical protein ACO1NS_07110 [Daejeonella sp.]|uniref:hypothetical protein n=1 Tax=Daejeonella sp. JGW-45 TaxID=3034148 RepID=UPI0023EDE8DF|nr:hypothetical protein [Daejeonella sp. JGW-45]